MTAEHDELLARLVDEFLGWPLPRTFAPDCGISFDGRKDDEWNKNKTWPIGTNLFTADEARKMFEKVAMPIIREQAAQADRAIGLLTVARNERAEAAEERAADLTAKLESAEKRDECNDLKAANAILRNALEAERERVLDACGRHMSTNVFLRVAEVVRSS